MKSFAVISARFMHEALGKLGSNDHEGSRHCIGLSDNDLDVPSSTQPLATFTALLRLAADERNDALLGVKLARSLTCDVMGDHTTLALTAGTVGEGLEKFCKNFQWLQTGTHCTLGVSDHLCRLTYKIADPSVQDRKQDAEFTLVMLLSMLQRSMGSNWKDGFIEFEHAASGNASAYKHFFDCAVAFNRVENSITFPRYLLERVPDSIDPGLHRYIEGRMEDRFRQAVSESDFASDVKAWMVAAIWNSNTFDIEDAASYFCMSLRTIQRRLRDCNATFVNLRTHVRASLGAQMLRYTDLPIPSIAEQLAFSEPSAFMRGFKYQVGEGPAGYRSAVNRSNRARV